jgi:hypothetical protein
MAVTKGMVGNLKVSQEFDLALFWIEEEDTGTPELFILWEPPAAPFDQIYHNAWLSMLRDAISHALPVQIGHDEDSSIVNELLIARSSP